LNRGRKKINKNKKVKLKIKNADSHRDKTAVKPGAAADKTAQNKIYKYARPASTHIFCPFATKMRECGIIWPSKMPTCKV